METITSSESNHYNKHEAASDTESDQLDWDPEKLMMTALGGRIRVHFGTHTTEGPLDEDEASSLTPWRKDTWKFGKTCLQT